MRISVGIHLFVGIVLALAAPALALLSDARPRAAQAATKSTCNRSCLKGFLDRYFDAIAAHYPSKLPVTPDVRFTENGMALKLGEGLWKTAGAATYRLDVLDPQSGGAAAEAVVEEGTARIGVFARLRIDNNRISEVETIRVRRGEMGLFDVDKLTLATPPHSLYAEAVSPAERGPREQLAAVADAYFTAIQTQGFPGYKPAPFAPDANRYENGVQTTNVPFDGRPAMTAAEQFDRGMFKGLITPTDRRYPVIDLERGIAVAVVVFRLSPPPDQSTQGPATPQTDPAMSTVLLAEIFKVTGGRIRAIHATMNFIPRGASAGWK